MRNPEFQYGTPNDDVVDPAFWKFNGLAGNDFVLIDEFSLPSADGSIILLGKSGDDFLLIQGIEGVSAQAAFGGLGNDDIRVLAGRGSGGPGDDSLGFVRNSAIPVDAILKGGDGNDRFNVNTLAGTGTVVARGGEGDDVFSFFLDKGTGRARLIGGEGADIFGADLFVGFGRATVVDFDFAEGDRLSIPRRALSDVVQEVGGTPEDPFLLVSSTVRVGGGEDFVTSYKLLGLDAPLSDAAFI